MIRSFVFLLGQDGVHGAIYGPHHFSHAEIGLEAMEASQMQNICLFDHSK
jgi:hypothetical protein